jgi:hypothetical protein
MADAETDRENAEEGGAGIEPAPVGELSAVRSLDDRLYLKGHLDGIDDAGIVERALAAATRPDRDDEWRSPPSDGPTPSSSCAATTSSNPRIPPGSATEGGWRSWPTW